MTTTATIMIIRNGDCFCSCCCCGGGGGGDGDGDGGGGGGNGGGGNIVVTTTTTTTTMRALQPLNIFSKLGVIAVMIYVIDQTRRDSWPRKKWLRTWG